MKMINNFRETAQAFNSSPTQHNNNPLEIDSPPLEASEAIRNEDQRAMTTDTLEEEMRKSKSILQSCIGILSNFSIIGLIFFFYFEINFGNEILYILTTTFQIISVMLIMLKKGRENKKFSLVERMHIFFITVNILIPLFFH